MKGNMKNLYKIFLVLIEASLIYTCITAQGQTTEKAKEQFTKLPQPL
jgi:hypothetical protein